MDTVVTCLKAGFHRPLIFDTLADVLFFRHISSRFGRIKICFAYRPAMAFVTVSCLLFAGLSFLGVNEQFVGCYRFCDCFIFRRRISHYVCSVFGSPYIVNAIGVIVWPIMNPDGRIKSWEQGDS